MMNGRFCGDAWDAISRYVYTALQGGSIMHKWTNDERMMNIVITAIGILLALFVNVRYGVLLKNAEEASKN